MTQGSVDMIKDNCQFRHTATKSGNWADIKFAQNSSMGIAQLVERVVWDHEAAGSIPASRIVEWLAYNLIPTLIIGWPLFL